MYGVKLSSVHHCIPGLGVGTEWTSSICTEFNHSMHFLIQDGTSQKSEGKKGYKKA